MPTSPVLEIDGLTNDYTGGQRALDNVSLSASAGELLVILAHNASGKSTFLRCARLNGADLREARRSVAMIFQTANLVRRRSALTMSLASRPHADAQSVCCTTGAADAARTGPVCVAALRERGFHVVYVLDGIANDVGPTGIISERLRIANVRNVQTIYELMAEATQARDQVAKDGAHVLPDVPLDIGEKIERQLQQLKRDAEDLLGEALETKTPNGLASLKSHDNYTFEHS